MGTAVYGVNIIRKREHKLVIAVVVLHRDLDGYRVLGVLSREVDNLGVNGVDVLFLVQEFYKGADTALIVEVLLNNIFLTLVAKLDVNARVEESLFSQTLLEDLVLINRGLLKNLAVSFEADFRTALG